MLPLRQQVDSSLLDIEYTVEVVLVSLRDLPFPLALFQRTDHWQSDSYQQSHPTCEQSDSPRGLLQQGCDQPRAQPFQRRSRCHFVLSIHQGQCHPVRVV